MRRNFFVWLCIAVVASAFASHVNAQTPASVSTHYRVLPRHSTMHQTGGIGGLDLTYRVMGEYDFVRSSTTGGPKFANAEMWGSILSDLPTPAYVVDVDQIFNLKGLEGKPLPILAPPTLGPFDAFKFRGIGEDGSSIDLIAARLGQWMYLRGWTQPPPGKMDYFSYQLRVLARTAPFADFNADDVVDAADFALLRKGKNASSIDLTIGVGLADWRQQFGERVPDLAALDAMASAAMSGLSMGAAVPEPANAAVVVIAVAAMFTLRGRRNGGD
jgi:hypothetical protein